MNLIFSLIAAAAAMLTIDVAQAQQIRVDSECCGRVYIDVGAGGRVSGYYPKQDGRISGTGSSGGTARGIWTQPKSDHPCRHARAGTYAWGHFVISDLGGPDMSGYWGYCDERPDHDWGFRF